MKKILRNNPFKNLPLLFPILFVTVTLATTVLPSTAEAGWGTNGIVQVYVQPDRSEIYVGDTVVVTWESGNATSCELRAYVGNDPKYTVLATSLTGSDSFTPNVTTSYEMYCVNNTQAGGPYSNAVTETVIVNEVPTATLTVTTTNVDASWTITESGGSSWSDSGTSGTTATYTVNPGFNGKTYTISVNPSDTNVINSDGGTTSLVLGAGGEKGFTLTAPSIETTVKLTASPATVATGATSELKWTTNNPGVTTCVATSVSPNDASWPVGQNVGGSGSTRTVNPKAPSTTYGITCTNVNTGQSADDTVTVTVAPNPVTVDLKINDQDYDIVIVDGVPFDRSWTSTNAAVCEFSSPFNSGVNLSGSNTTNPGHPYYPTASSPKVFTVTCWENSNKTGSQDTESIAVSVIEPFNYSLSNGGSRTATAGESTTNTITVTKISGGAQNVSLNATVGGSSPNKPTVSISPSSCTPNNICPSPTPTVTISTTTNTPAGTYIVTVTGTPLGKTTQFAVTVPSAEPEVSAYVDLKINGQDANIAITSGDAFNYSWNSENAGICEFSSPFNSGVSGSGSQTIFPGHAWYPTSASPKTFTVSCWMNPSKTDTPSTESITVSLAAPVAQPDLTAGGVTPTTATAGASMTFYATVSNIGSGSTGAGFPVLFQVADSSAGSGATNIGSSNTTLLGANSSRSVASPSYTFPSAPNTTKYVRACADLPTGAVTESNENNNCGGWTAVASAAAAVPCPNGPDGTAQCPCPSEQTWNGSSCEAPAGPVATFNYSLSNSGTTRVTKGGVNTYGQNVISKNLITNPSQTVDLTLSGVPSGVTYTISDRTCSPTCQSSILFTVSPSAPAGTYTITVTGTPLNKTIPFNLVIENSAAIVATCSASPSSALIGQTVTWTADVSGGVPPYSYSWSGTHVPTNPAPSTNQFNITYSTTTPPPKTVQVLVTDSLGNTGNCSPMGSINVNFDPKFEEF